MLKHRLLFGTLMILLLIGLIFLDSRLEYSIGMSQGNTHQIQGTIICLLLAILAIPAQFELAGLMKRANIQIFKAIVILASVGFATSWYWRQFFYNAFEFHLYYVLFIAVVSFLAIFSYQARKIDALCSKGRTRACPR